MGKVCVINVVGLTPELLADAPNLAGLGTAVPWKAPVPAVTCTSQATMLTGLMPRQHGIVGNGWYDRASGEVRFWQQSNHLIQGRKFYEGIETAKLFWWYNQGAPVRWSATPKPHYGCDGSKVFGILDQTECDLEKELGKFPFFTFWGPKAGLPCSQWIAKAACRVLEQKQPPLTLVYLPHLDYDFQRHAEPDRERVREVDRCAAEIIQVAHGLGIEVIAVSEYGLVPVDRPVAINQHLRRAGWLAVRDGPFGEMLQPLDSQAFAVVDHQVAHVYVARPESIPAVARELRSLPGIAAVVEPGELALDHPRSGDLIALAEPNAWFTYYYWLDDQRAPDFARTVDIHRKPGYDPCELFMTSGLRAGWRLLQKLAGFRYKMDVIPLEPHRVRGSHGLANPPALGPVIIGTDPPDDMCGFSNYVQERLRA